MMSSAPKVYLINLDRDLDRLSFVQDQLTKLSMPFERISAVYGLDMPAWLKPYFLDEEGRIASSLTAGEVGCYASHLMVMRRIAEGGQPALVLEDDVEIGAALPSILTRIDELPKGWEIIRLSNPTKRRRFPIKTIIDGHEVIKYGVVPPSTGAYLITPRGAHKFLTYRSLRNLPVDQDLRHVWTHGLITYGIHPLPVIPDQFGPSSIAKFGKIKQCNRATLRDKIQRIRFELQWLGAINWIKARL